MTTHIVGAGLAGLSAAVALAAQGRQVTLYEATAQAGGRCRSYFDRELGQRIDNGNHLLLAANRSALTYLETIGAAGTLTGPADPALSFLDLGTGERWTVRPGLGRWPGWVLDPSRRVAGTGPLDYAGVLRLATAGEGASVADRLDASRSVNRRLWHPVAVSALNTEIETASARLYWRVLVEIFGQGGAAMRPLVARDGLSESFVDPALAYLAARGGTIRYGERVRGLDLADARVTGLQLASGPVALAPADDMVLAVPPPVAAELLPGLTVPTRFRGIVNAHYRLDRPLGEEIGILGLVGGLSEWVFTRGPIASVTISAADRVIDRPAEALLADIWTEVSRALSLPPVPMPPGRLVKEKRATFAATPDQLARRPKPQTAYANLVLAGDWVETGLPATIEGSVRSGQQAAAILSRNHAKHLTQTPPTG